MTQRLAPLPRVTSKTITVGSLLGKIKRLILAEPKRLNMNTWVSAFRGRSRTGRFNSEQPACGTVACMAGWGAVLLRPDTISMSTLYRRTEYVMGEALGADVDGHRSVGNLFCAGSLSDFGEFAYQDLPDAGTPEHAAVIAKRIDTYLSQHPEIIKRKIIVADVQKALRA